MRATTRRLIGLKISMVLVSGRVITTWPLAIATWLNPGFPGNSTIATCLSLAADATMEHVKIRKKDNSSFRIAEVCLTAIRMRVAADSDAHPKTRHSAVSNQPTARRGLRHSAN